MNFNEPGLYERALMLCIDAHFKTRRRFNAEPYSNHPMAVCRMVSGMGVEYEIVALLHDIVEDTDVTLEGLRLFGFQDYIIEAIDAISQRQNESNMDYIKRCNKNKIARIVKVADMMHNLQDFYRYGKEKQVKDIQKQILYIVEEGLDD